MSTWCLLLAAGRGERFGGAEPKQYAVIAGRRSLDWAFDAASAAVDGIVLVTPDGCAPPGGLPGREHVEVRLAGGGERRSDSVRAGLVHVPDDAEVIVVHDTARPAATSQLFAAVVEAVQRGADGAVPGLALTDTVKRVMDGVVVETPDRSTLVAVQTPQAFAAGALRRAHRDGADATDDAALVEAAGGKVVVVPGDPRNVKLTRPEDVASLERALS